MSDIRILLADDHEIVREGVRAMIHSAIWSVSSGVPNK